MEIKQITPLKLLLCFAYKGEASAFLRHFKATLKPLGHLNALQFFQSEKIDFLITDEGPENARMKLSIVLGAEARLYSQIINIGVAGSLSDKTPLDTIVMVKSIYAHNAEGPLYKSFHAKPLDIGAHVTRDLVTVDRRIKNSQEAQKLKVMADIVDREAHALAQVADFFQMKFQSVKIISDAPWEVEETDLCQMVKEKAAFLSQELLQYFLQSPFSVAEQRLDDQEEKVGVINASLTKILGQNFYFTHSMQYQLERVLSSLKEKDEAVEKVLMRIDLVSLEEQKISKKERGNLLIRELNRLLVPEMNQFQDELQKLRESLKQHQIQLKFAPEFDRPEGVLEIPFDTRYPALTRARLGIIPLEKIKNLFDGELHV